MMWMALARVIVNKPGTALIFGLAQGITVMLLGFFGSHGVFSIVSYSLPGLAVEIFALFFKVAPPTTKEWGGEAVNILPHAAKQVEGKTLSIIHYPLSILFVLSVYCVVANMTGTLVVAIVVMQLPFLPLMISIVCSFLSGMMGGYFAMIVFKRLVKYMK